MSMILVVDDTRHFVADKPGDIVVHVEHSWDAVAALRSSFFDHVWLDYDLHGDDKGSNVARFVRDNVDGINYNFTAFHIHSFNPAGRTAMKQILKDGGIVANMESLENFVNIKRQTSFGETE